MGIGGHFAYSAALYRQLHAIGTRFDKVTPNTDSELDIGFDLMFEQTYLIGAVRVSAPSPGEGLDRGGPKHRFIFIPRWASIGWRRQDLHLHHRICNPRFIQPLRHN